MNRLLIIALLLVSNNSFGQKSKMSFERLKALKMSYITERIGLTEAEESVFWEIYGQYEKRIFDDCRINIKNLRKTYMKSKDIMNNDKALEMIKKINALEQHALQLKVERDKSLLEKFSAVKILKMHHAEYHFNREMVYKMRKKQEDPKNN
jgi:hypothetical protein